MDSAALKTVGASCVLFLISIFKSILPIRLCSEIESEFPHSVLNLPTMERDIVITFYDTCYSVRTSGNGHHLGMFDVLATLAEARTEMSALSCTEMSALSLIENVYYPLEEIQEDGGYFEVGDCGHLFIKDHWKVETECLFDKTEKLARDMMLSKKSEKARSSAPSAWTAYIGFGSNHKEYKGFCTSAPFTEDLGFSSARLSTCFEKSIFKTVQQILQFYFPTFAVIFERAGRIDLKFNSTISQSDNHYDRQDKCHQVIFTLGRSQECLMIREGEKDVQPVAVKCHRNPTAFDGRFQHWVEQYGTNLPRDRMSVVCYLVDVPEDYKHPKMNMATICKHISK